MLPSANYAFGVAEKRRTEVVEIVRQALTGPEWALVKVSGGENTILFSAPPRIREKIEEVLRATNH